MTDRDKSQLASRLCVVGAMALLALAEYCSPGAMRMLEEGGKR